MGKFWYSEARQGLLSICPPPCPLKESLESTQLILIQWEFPAVLTCLLGRSQHLLSCLVQCSLTIHPHHAFTRMYFQNHNISLSFLSPHTIEGSRDFLGQPTQPETQTVVWVLGIWPLTSPETLSSFSRSHVVSSFFPNPQPLHSRAFTVPYPHLLCTKGPSQTEDLKTGVFSKSTLTSIALECSNFPAS